MRDLQHFKTGDAQAVLNEASLKRAEGDLTVENAILLSGAQCYLGHGHDAETYAREALSRLETVESPSDHNRTILLDMARIALYDAQMAQGQFSKAAHGLRSYIESGAQPHMLAEPVR